MKIKNLIKKKKIFCFDIDGVICKTPNNYYKNSKPIKRAIKKINSLYDSGDKILIFTARFMGRSGENVFKAKKRGYNFTYMQLKKWGVKFDKLIFGKPSFDHLIDDKCITFKEDWYKRF
jgi:histidinol phosphatase-like enzyme